MAIRASMTALVARVAALVADPDHTVFTDVYKQDALDRHRMDVRMLALTLSERISPAGVYEWRDYYTGGDDGAVWGAWETDALLQSLTFADITADPGTTIDYLTGHVSFTATQYPPVYWTGQTYDVYAAAADLCEERAALTSDQYDMRDNNSQQLYRSQVPVNWAARATMYRRRARLITGALVRSDAGVAG